jgi:hypothetical protein
MPTQYPLVRGQNVIVHMGKRLVLNARPRKTWNRADRLVLGPGPQLSFERDKAACRCDGFGLPPPDYKVGTSM